MTQAPSIYPDHEDRYIEELDKLLTYHGVNIKGISYAKKIQLQKQFYEAMANESSNNSSNLDVEKMIIMPAAAFSKLTVDNLSLRAVMGDFNDILAKLYSNFETIKIASQSDCIDAEADEGMKLCWDNMKLVTQSNSKR